jgi:hypothetical protein
MKSLRIISGAIGAVVSLFVCAPFAVEWVFHAAPPSAVTLAVGIAFGPLALAGPFALFMAATLSEGQYTRGNRRFLFACLIVGAAIVLLAMARTLRVQQYLFCGSAALSLGCMATVAWCLCHKTPENA